MNETHTHISKTEFVTLFFDVSVYDTHSLAGLTYSDPMGPSFAVPKTVSSVGKLFFLFFLLFTLTFSKITEDNKIGECCAQDGGKKGTVHFEKAHGSEPTQLRYLTL
jgi:hypothetical protein